MLLKKIWWLVIILLTWSLISVQLISIHRPLLDITAIQSCIIIDRCMRRCKRHLIVADMSINGGGGGGVKFNPLFAREKDAECSETENMYVFWRKILRNIFSWCPQKGFFLTGGTLHPYSPTLLWTADRHYIHTVLHYYTPLSDISSIQSYIIIDRWQTLHPYSPTLL